MILLTTGIIIQKIVHKNIYDDTVMYRSYSGIPLLQGIDEFAESYDEAYSLIVDSHETLMEYYGY